MLARHVAWVSDMQTPCMHAGMEDQMVANHSEHTLAVSDEIQTHDLRITTTDQCVLHTYGQQQTQLQWLVNYSTAAQRDGYIWGSPTSCLQYQLYSISFPVPAQ